MKPMFLLPNALALSHLLMEQCIREGDAVIDATAGNGKDTLFLARLVGESGVVYAFDVQQDAIERTRERLREAGLQQRVRLFCTGHQNMKEHVDRPVRFAAFNLGYLPGGDKAVTTRRDTTREAVRAALELLEPGGICAVCVYVGHPEGEEELRMLQRFAAELNPSFAAAHFAFINQPKLPPELIAIQRQS